jgi:hypothetical protein
MNKLILKNLGGILLLTIFTVMLAFFSQENHPIGCIFSAIAGSMTAMYCFSLLLEMQRFITDSVTND